MAESLFTELTDTQWERASRRWLLSGPPNSGKTTSLRTFPQPVIVQSYLMEKGYSSIQGVAKAFVPRDFDPLEVVNWQAVINDTTKLTAEIISGKHGECATFAADGLHKLYEAYLAAATGGASIRGEDFEAKLYMGAANKFFAYINMIYNSKVPMFVGTVWDGLEKDNPEDKDKQASSHVFPELPGKSAKRIMGEFSVALGCKIQGTGKAASYLWQTKPQGRVWGAGMKIPLEIYSAIPDFVPQDYATLAAYFKPQIKKEKA